MLGLGLRAAWHSVQKSAERSILSDMAGARPDLRTTLGTVCEIQFVYGAAVPATVATVGAD